MTIDLNRRAVDLDGLKTADGASKRASFDADVSALIRHYEDDARGLTMARLAELGVGIKDNRRPLEVSLIRWVVDQLAVAYASAPARWVLGKSGKRLGEKTAEHKAMVAAYEASQIDLALREADRLRALCRQVVIRLYPVDELKRVEVRLFTPDLVMRAPHPAVGSSLDFDARFALRLAGGVLEYWSKDDAGWSAVWTDKNGAMLDDDKQPFADTGHRVPYALAAAQLIYDGYPAGRAWLPPRTHRLATIDAVNMLANELLELVRSQAHSQRVFTGVEHQDVPTERGPGVDLALRSDTARALDLTPNPKINEASNVLTRTLRDFLASEGLPVDMLEAGRQILTGAGLKTQLRGLIERRKGQLPLASGDERSLWTRYRSVHNTHAAAWGKAPLADVQMDVELAPMDLPVDGREASESGARDLALGLASRVDLTMRTRNVSRQQAIRILEQVDADRRDYPPHVAPDAQAAMEAGPRTVTAPDAAKNGAAGVVDAIRKSDPPPAP
jgi:hypothetical protein